MRCEATTSHAKWREDKQCLRRAVIGERFCSQHEARRPSLKVGDRIRCVKEFKSEVYPDADYGVLGREYMVTNVYDTGGTCVQPRYIGTDPPLGQLSQGEWVNASRFEKV